MSFVFPPTNFEITTEELIMFHNTDRKVFTRLVVNLGRDPAESMRIMALWLWLERARLCRNLVHQILPLPLTLVNAIADEAVMILTCIEHDGFLPIFLGMEIELTGNFALSEISLRYFHGVRMSVLRGVTQLVREVCQRTFQDILDCLLETNNYRINHHNSILDLPRIVRDARIGYVPYVEGGHDTNVVLSNSHIVAPRAHLRGGVPRVSEISSAFNGGCGLSYQRELHEKELSSLLENITLNENGVVVEEEIVPVADRTIFLTFSKGYPITETEVLNFITRRYGRDCIEAIFMQDVLPDEQALYARLVVKSTSIISLVLGGKSRAKFSINGKHVWARKYVRKQSQDASTSSTNATRHN